MEQLIFHVDVNSAYLSWEAARRVAAGKEDLRLIPSAISGNPENRTGVILAKSIPAKKYGVRTGEPAAMALRKALIWFWPDRISGCMKKIPMLLYRSAACMRRWSKNSVLTNAFWT